MKILEHCCYRKYLNEWWQEHQLHIQAFESFVQNAIEGHKVIATPPVPEDTWTLINYGDHTLIELLDWCINMCFCKEGVRVTLAMPLVSEDTEKYLKGNKFVGKYELITREIVPDIHTQIATISGGGRFFVLQGNLIQSVCPGKYITTMGITERYYESIQPLLNSWIRLYLKNRDAQTDA